VASDQSTLTPDAWEAGLTPRLTPETYDFFTGGARGELMIYRCSACMHFTHPPSPRCPTCLTMTMRPVPVSGRGVVISYSVNHYQWHPAFRAPYPIAIVELDEQQGLRLTTRIVGPDALNVQIGAPVRVTFEAHDQVWLPLFEVENPSTPGASSIQ
jgi:uncharacterized OB-fold protein